MNNEQKVKVTSEEVKAVLKRREKGEDEIDDDFFNDLIGEDDMEEEKKEEKKEEDVIDDDFFNELIGEDEETTEQPTLPTQPSATAVFTKEEMTSISKHCTSL